MPVPNTTSLPSLLPSFHTRQTGAVQPLSLPRPFAPSPPQGTVQRAALGSGLPRRQGKARCRGGQRRNGDRTTANSLPSSCAYPLPHQPYKKPQLQSSLQRIVSKSLTQQTRFSVILTELQRKRESPAGTRRLHNCTSPPFCASSTCTHQPLFCLLSPPS